MVNYKCVIFDIDGTILNTESGILNCIDYILEMFNLPEIPEETKRRFIGPPIQDSMEMYFDCTKERAFELAEAWRKSYKEKFLFDAVPYEGIYDLLKTIRAKGIKTAVATNKREDYVKSLLEHFQFLPLFDCIAGSDFAGERTKADMIRYCMEFTGTNDPALCLMIGDTEGDHKAAMSSGVGFMGVSYGFGFDRDIRYDFPVAGSCLEVQELLCLRPGDIIMVDCCCKLNFTMNQ